MHRDAIDLAAMRAANQLSKEHPRDSAHAVLSPSQKLLAILLFAGLMLALTIKPIAALLSICMLAGGFFVLSAVYRGALMVIGARDMPIPDRRSDAPPDITPTITILVPLYNDADSLAPLARALTALEYPEQKKDVKLLLEANDQSTVDEAYRLGLQDQFEILEIPAIGPRTKPKACNVGLQFARGDIVVIYDAEDQPECDQLRKAAAAFSSAHPNLACLQARLNYYNASENWLTRLFTLEYSLWFEWLLPALQRIEAPIPLGGTSNFFRTDLLREVGAWDPYNVTEDADLGLRLSRAGYRVEMLDSTTFEEANCRAGNWIRQRSRWIKGHLQTWLVHMRRPKEIVRSTGWSGFLSVQLFLAGNVISALVSPLLWLLFLFQLSAPNMSPAGLSSEALADLNFIALLLGNTVFISTAALAPLKRGWTHLSLFALTAPFYWLLASLAAYKALWQIVFRPHYWEKTTHVLSTAAMKRRAEALKALQPG